MPESSSSAEPRQRAKPLIRRSLLLVPYPRHDPITPTKPTAGRVITPLRVKQNERLAKSRKDGPLPMYCFSEQPIRRRLFVSPTTVPSSVKGETDDIPEDWML